VETCGGGGRHERRQSDTERKEEREEAREVRALTSRLEERPRRRRMAGAAEFRRILPPVLERKRRTWRRLEASEVDCLQGVVEVAEARLMVALGRRGVAGDDEAMARQRR
jgi:hypothetical protein